LFAENSGQNTEGLAFYNNTCITFSEGFGCPDESEAMTVYGNKVYSLDGKAKTCKGTSGEWPADAAVTALGAATLLPFPVPAASTGRDLDL
jgi:hypothetical protein